MTARAAPAPPTRLPGRGRVGLAERGFTLIETLAVVAVTALFMVLVVNVYLEFSQQTLAATELTHDSRRAIGILDRIARDLEAAVLVVKPEELDPLSHPWVFLAEDRGRGDGAEKLRFITRSRIPRSTALHESDLEVVCYVLREAEDGGFELMRWSSPRLPEELDRSFPADEGEGAVRFAEGLASFGVRFLDDEGEWKSEWDSSTLIDSSDLPVAAEIAVALLPENDPLGEQEPEAYVRRVLIPVRPLDLQALLEGPSPGSEDDEEEDCVTVGDCIAAHPDEFEARMAADPSLRDVIDSIRDQCFSNYAATFPIAAEDCQ